MSSRKIKNIVKGFTTAEPTEQDWYKHRMSVCGSCEYNTENMEESSVSTANRLKVNSICGGGGVCNACGCCISKKARVEESVCGLVEIGKEPKWTAVVETNPTDKRLSVTCLDSTFKVYRELPRIVLEREFTEDEKKVEFELLFSHKDKFSISRSDSSCGCTVPTEEKVDERNSKLVVQVSTVGFRGKVSERSLSVFYDVGVGTYKKVSIKLRFKKV